MQGDSVGSMRVTVYSLCLAHVLTMIGGFSFPALLPMFQQEWELSGTDAGWISGIYFITYALCIPFFATATDRIDAKRIYFAGAVVTAFSTLGFALMAEGFWTAMIFRALSGVALSATYMPGLRALVDRTQGPRQPRWMSWYTASFSLGTSLSFLLSGVVAESWGWRSAYWVATVAALGAVMVAGMLKSVVPPPVTHTEHPLDFRPVLRHRPVMGYVFGYVAHVWELLTVRSWLVAFLTFVAAREGGATGLTPTQIATACAILAMVGSIGGADLALRFGRRQLCALAALLSGLMALGIGLASSWSYGCLAALLLFHSVAMQLDSAALTTGAIMEAEPGRRGLTIAVHSLLGFMGGFLGPLVFGWALDQGGGQDQAFAWTLAFGSVAVVSLLAPLALLKYR